MLIEERAGRRVLVDEQGVEVRPREAVVSKARSITSDGWPAIA